MEKFRKILFFTGLSFCVFTVICLIIMWFFPATYLVRAISNAFILPFTWGVFFILFSFLLKKEQRTFKTFFKKAIYVILLIPMINYNYSADMVGSVSDIRAVLANDLYVTEGIVIDTYINRKSGTGSSASTSTRDRYTQRIELDNGDHFTLPVEHQEDYRFQLGETYEITALPYSRTVLEWEMIKKESGD